MGVRTWRFAEVIETEYRMSPTAGVPIAGGKKARIPISAVLESERASMYLIRLVSFFSIEF